MSKPVPIELRIPPQDGAPFTRFATTLAGAAGWCDALPMADPPGVAQRLRDTLLELNRAPLDPELRYELLETLRPSLTQTLTLLDRVLINQPLAMPPRMQALAAVSDQIGGLACTAYSICVMHAAREPARITRRAPARLVCEALERSLHYAAHKVLLALNLQLPIESRTWSTLHQLYLLGERYRLTDLAVPAATGGESTLRNTWLLPLLLACCHTGQLLRSDINVLHAALRHSAPRCAVQLASEPGLFAVDLGGASPPVYRASMATLGKQVRVLDTTEMLKPLTQASAMARKANRSGVLLGDTRIPLPVLEHLLDCLGSERERGSRRVIVREPLQAVLGFSATHFHLAGERTLDELVQKPGARKAKPSTENPFLVERKSDDPWSAAPDTDRNHSSLNRDGSINVLARARTEKTTAPELPAGFSVLQVTTVDPAQGAIAWTGAPPRPQRYATGNWSVYAGIRKTPGYWVSYAGHIGSTPVARPPVLKSWLRGLSPGPAKPCATGPARPPRCGSLSCHQTGFHRGGRLSSRRAAASPPATTCCCSAGRSSAPLPWASRWRSVPG